MQDSLLKQCTKCGEFKSLDCFYKDKTKKSGYASYCKQCQKEYDDARGKTKERQEYSKAKRKEYYKNHKEQENKRNAQYYANNRDKCLILGRIYYRNNTDACKARAKQYKENNPDKIQQQKELRRLQWHNNIDELRRKSREYRQQHKDRILTLRQQPERKIANNISAAIYYSLKGNKCGLHWESLVGYSLRDLMTHLESQFTSEMNWNNYGSYWEIDHIIPINTFCLTSYEDPKFKICWSLMNLRPLTVSENRTRPKDGLDISECVRQQILGQNL